jgi:hypothetical protein
MHLAFWGRSVHSRRPARSHWHARRVAIISQPQVAADEVVAPRGVDGAVPREYSILISKKGVVPGWEGANSAPRAGADPKPASIPDSSSGRRSLVLHKSFFHPADSPITSLVLPPRCEMCEGAREAPPAVFMLSTCRKSVDMGPGTLYAACTPPNGLPILDLSLPCWFVWFQSRAPGSWLLAQNHHWTSQISRISVPRPPTRQARWARPP